jgi:hypothetical protein
LFPLCPARKRTITTITGTASNTHTGMTVLAATRPL